MEKNKLQNNCFNMHFAIERNVKNVKKTIINQSLFSLNIAIMQINVRSIAILIG